MCVCVWGGGPRGYGYIGLLLQFGHCILYSGAVFHGEFGLTMYKLKLNYPKGEILLINVVNIFQ